MEGMFSILSGNTSTGIRLYVTIQRHFKPGRLDKEVANTNTILTCELADIAEFQNAINELKADLDRLSKEAAKLFPDTTQIK